MLLLQEPDTHRWCVCVCVREWTWSHETSCVSVGCRYSAAKNSLDKSLKKSLNNTIHVKGYEISREWFWVLFECPLTRFSSQHLPVFPSHHSFSLPFLLALQCHHIMNKYRLRCTILSAVLLLFYHSLFLLLWYTSWNENKTENGNYCRTNTISIQWCRTQNAAVLLVLQSVLIDDGDV